MNFKRLFLLLIVLLLFSSFFVDSIFALDNVTSDDSVDCLSVSSDFDDVLGRSYSLNGGGFSDVRDVISRASDGDTIKLSGKFTSDGKIINVNKKLKFTSPDGAVFDGKDKAGIFYIKNKAKGSSFYNLKFINGKRFAASAMFIDAKDITLDKCEFRDNHGTGNGGGAVATIWDKNNASGLTVKNCVFKANSAPASSGALAAFSTNFKIINCVFENNNAKNDAGAIQIDQGSTDIINSEFKNNTCKKYAGAIKINTNNIKITNTKFTSNTAKYGGSISINKNDAEISDSDFKNNSATYGGAIYINQDFTTEITSSTFINNKADNGSAIYNKGNLKITDSDIKDNTAKSYKLESNNTNVKQGQTATIKAYLEYGDNTPGIYTTNTLIIDEKTPTLPVAAQNQQITLNISNTIYKSKTNKKGIATFKIQTKKLTKNNYTFTLKHSTSTTATQIINNNTTLTIQKENKTDNTKKTN